MRNIIKYILLVASFSLLTTSCKKPDEEIVVKAEGIKFGEELQKIKNDMNFSSIYVYQNNSLSVFTTKDYEIDGQYLTIKDGSLYWKFNLNEFKYYSLDSGASWNILKIYL